MSLVLLIVLVALGCFSFLTLHVRKIAGLPQVKRKIIISHIQACRRNSNALNVWKLDFFFRPQWNIDVVIHFFYQIQRDLQK